MNECNIKSIVAAWEAANIAAEKVRDIPGDITVEGKNWAVYKEITEGIKCPRCGVTIEISKITVAIMGETVKEIEDMPDECPYCGAHIEI